MPYFRQEETINAGAYMRLSREDLKLGESNSISNQRALLTNFIKNNGMTMVDEYIDDGFTGTNFDRPAFKALIEDCRSRRLNCVVVKDLSRLGRDAVMAGRYIDEIFPQMGIRFIAIGDSYDSNDTLYTGLDMTTPFKNLCNEMYARDISRKIRVVNDIKRERGDFMGGHPPYGYIRDPEDKNHLIVDEVAAPVIRTIFDMKMNGYGCVTIARKLNEMGVETPLQRLKRTSGRNFAFTDEEIENSRWRDCVITKILQNETYTGTIVTRKSGRPNYKIHKLQPNDKSLWVRVPGMHEPIISKELFDYTQDLFKRIQESTALGKVRPMAGFVRCGDCGMLMAHFGSPNTPQEYLNCSSYFHKEGCFSHNINMRYLEGTVLGEMRTLIERLYRARKKLEKDGKDSYRDDTVKSINESIAKELEQEKHFMEMKNRLLEDKVNGMIAEEDFADMNSQFEALLKETEERIVALQTERAKVTSKQMDLMPWIDSIMEFRGIEELSRKAVVMMIEFIYVYKDKRVEVRFRYHDEIQDLLSATR